MKKQIGVLLFLLAHSFVIFTMEDGRNWGAFFAQRKQEEETAQGWSSYYKSKPKKPSIWDACKSSQPKHSDNPIYKHLKKTPATPSIFSRFTQEPEEPSFASRMWDHVTKPTQTNSSSTRYTNYYSNQNNNDNHNNDTSSNKNNNSKNNNSKNSGGGPQRPPSPPDPTNTLYFKVIKRVSWKKITVAAVAGGVAYGFAKAAFADGKKTTFDFDTTNQRAIEFLRDMNENQLPNMVTLMPPGMQTPETIINEASLSTSKKQELGNLLELFHENKSMPKNALLQKLVKIMHLSNQAGPEMTHLVTKFFDFYATPVPKDRHELFMLMAQDQWEEKILEEMTPYIYESNTLSRVIEGWEILKDAKRDVLIDPLKGASRSIIIARPPQAERHEKPTQQAEIEPVQEDESCCLL